MAHPYPVGCSLFQGVKDLVGFIDEKFCSSVFPYGKTFNLSPEKLHHEVHSVTDAQNGNPQAKDPLVRFWSVLLVNRTRSTGKYDALGVKPFYGRGIKRGDVNLAPDPQLADPSRYKLSILGTEIKDYYSFHGLFFEGYIQDLLQVNLLTEPQL